MACTIDHLSGDHLSHSIDLVTTLRSELAALTYKRDRLVNELTDTKGSLCAKENECETLRAQGARQSALITSLQQRLQATEVREKNLHIRSEQTSSTLQREKRGLEEKVKEMCSKQRRLELDLSSEETLKEQAKAHFADLIRKLGCVLGMDVSDSSHITPDCVLTKTNDVVNELQRLRSKLAGTCESLTTCEAELHGLRNSSTTERSHLNAQIESLKTITTGLEARCKSTERDLQLTRDRLTETDLGADKLRGKAQFIHVLGGFKPFVAAIKSKFCS
jgi:septal ring factor EnvC (AmiA/AmiB activator)